MKLITVNNTENLLSKNIDTPHIVDSSLSDLELNMNSDFYKVKIVNKGCESYKNVVGGRNLIPGRIIIFSPNIETTVNITTRTNGRCIYFSPQKVEQYYAELCSADLSAGDSKIDSDWRINTSANGNFIANKVISYFSSVNPHDSSQAHRILAEYIALLSSESRKLPLKKSSARKELLTRIFQAKSFIHDNKTNNINLLQVSEASRISQYHLSRSFHQVFGLPPIKYHHHLKMLEAVNLISSKQSISEVGLRLGFSSTSAFSKAYHKKFGHSPSLQIKMQMKQSQSQSHIL